MNVRNIKLDPAQFTPMLATECNVRFRYVDGQKTDEREGFSITVILPNMNYEKLNLKVESVPENLTRDALASSAPVSIAPVGNFTATLYQGSKGIGISLKADTAEIVKK